MAKGSNYTPPPASGGGGAPVLWAGLQCSAAPPVVGSWVNLDSYTTNDNGTFSSHAGDGVQEIRISNVGTLQSYAVTGVLTFDLDGSGTGGTFTVGCYQTDGGGVTGYLGEATLTIPAAYAGSIGCAIATGAKLMSAPTQISFQVIDLGGAGCTNLAVSATLTQYTP